jgi:hypothetical protein
MQLAMHPEAIYGYSLWAITALVIGGAVLGVLVIEGAARRLVRQDLRSAHNDVAGALVGVIGTTYAVLLAFVAMLAWEGFQQAETAAHAEAAAIRDVVAAFDGLPDITAMRAAVTDYTLAVVQVEWPAQARGEPVAVDRARRAAAACRRHHPGDHLDHAADGRWPDAGGRLVPRGAEPADASGDVIGPGGIGRAGAGADRGFGKSVPRRFPGLQRTLQPGARTAGLAVGTSFCGSSSGGL